MSRQPLNSQFGASHSPPASAFLPFALPDIGDDEILDVVDVLRSGWLTTGARTREFESLFAAAIGAGTSAVAVNSATAGLHLALEALGVGPGDEVITTTNTFTATAQVARFVGATPVLVDMDPATLCIDVERAEAAVTPRTRAIIPVHFGGRAADMDGVLRIATRHGLSVIEDAAHALPATYHGQKVGALASDATVFSFYANKTLTTGEGGMITTRNPDIAARCNVMRLHGMSRDAQDRYVASAPSWSYEIVAPGFKYNLSDIASAIGIHQLRRMGEMHAQRAAIASRFDAGLAGLPCRLPPHAERGDVHAWHLYVIQLTPDAPVDRDEFIQAMFDHGIGCSVHYIPLHRHAYWRDTYGLSPDQFPAAERYFHRTVSLPIFSRMSDADVDRVIDAAASILSR